MNIKLSTTSIATFLFIFGMMKNNLKS